MADTRRIVVYYAVWTTVCAGFAGLVVALVHTWFFSYNPGRSAFMHTLVGDIETAAAIAAGQGAVALVTGDILARFGRTLQFTVLLGLAIGLFDFVMYFLQMAVPKIELGWIPDLAILTVVTIIVTALGARRLESP